MREDLLHYVWKNQRFPTKTTLKTTSNQWVEVIDVGQYNTSSGPDFFNARIRIAGQEWAGNLEIHLKSSDWYAHRHEKDMNYDNVILHVVWEDDVVIFRKDGSTIPTLALQNYVNHRLLSSYRALVFNGKRKFINCEKEVLTIDNMIWQKWQERLFVERLEHKSKLIQRLLVTSNNDWETVLFMLLMKTFGLNKNGEAFLSMAKHMGSSMIKKVIKDAFQLESLFFGLAGLLDKNEVTDTYYGRLQQEFRFLGNKFQLQEYLGQKPIFHGLRPSNFPTIRLSQLASVYEKSPHLFGALMDANTMDDFFELFKVRASSYWDTHYTFGKESKNRRKTLTKSFVHLIVINTVIPIKFCYHQYLGKNQVAPLLEVLHELPAEKNYIVDRFQALGITSSTALDGQAKIQLYHSYCKVNRCLHCQVGADLLGRKSYF